VPEPKLAAAALRGELQPRQAVERYDARREGADVADERPGVACAHPRADAGPVQNSSAAGAMTFRRLAGLLCEPTGKDEPMTLDSRTRWLALVVLCLGTLMIVLDSTIVNVALPSIADDLGFSQDSLAWVVNAYLLTFGGFLLLGGRLGDLFGHRRLFIGGIAFFTVASLACGLSQTQGELVVARAVQGVGGAVASAVSLSLTMTLFTEPAERAKAMGIFGFVASGGGSIGVLLGGVLTGWLDWHWIFLVNLPIGIAVVICSLRLLPGGRGTGIAGGIDVGGAVTVTTALMVADYSIVNGNKEGWLSAQTLGLLALSAALLGAFVLIESRVAAPLMPLRLFKRRNICVANVVGVLWAGAMFAWFFLSAQYLQFVLGYDPMQVGLAFLAGNLVMMVLSVAVSARLVMRFGIKPPLGVGLLVAAIGLLLFARAPADGTYVVDVLPAMILLGIGAGIAFNPVLLAAMSDVGPEEAGLASGFVNTAFMMGGALGLAVLASLAASRTNRLAAAGHSTTDALLGGYHLAFVVGAVFAAAAAGIGVRFLRVQGAGAMAPHGDAAFAES
jgi:EmrB/QacA subfamily drug resistance transporter